MAIRTFTQSPVTGCRVNTRSSRSARLVASASGARQQLTHPIVLPSGAETKPVSLEDALKFSGPAPEILNGRVAMVGVLAAISSELSTGRSAWAQFAASPVPTMLLVLVLAYATLVPIMLGAKRTEAFGPLTPQVEKVNGRAAMLGLTTLFLIEAAKGSALL